MQRLIYHESGRVTGIHYKPSLLTPEQQAEGILVDSIPAPIAEPSIMMINPETKVVSYIYPEKPLNEQVRLIQKALDELILGV